jgi:hypothetical protein
MMLRTLLVFSVILSISAPAFACGPFTEAAPAPAQAAEEPDPMGQALVVTGDAVRIDNRQPASPVLYVGYPMVPGQASQGLYGAFFKVARDRNFRVLSQRIQKHQMPRVLLTRANTTAKWRVAAFL